MNEERYGRSRGSSVVSLRGLGNVAIRGSATAAVVAGLTLSSAPAVPAHNGAAKRALAVAAADGGLSAAAASHPRRKVKGLGRRAIGVGRGNGADPCAAGRVDRPTIHLEFGRSTFRLGVPFDICMKGFAQDEPIEVVVTRPDGSQASELVRHDPEHGVSSWRFLAYPPDPFGLYSVVATQGPRTAARSFTVIPPARPSFDTLLFGVRVGESLPFVLAGFDPGEKVAIYLYRRVGYNARTYRTIYRRARLPARSIRADEQGFALGKVTMRSRGQYLLSADGLAGAGAVSVR